MALVLANRVKETTTTAGTGTITLLGASTGYQSFAVIGNGNTTYYTIAGQTTSEWEVGIGTYTSSGTTLARTTVLANSAGTQPTALTFSAGTKDVFVTYPASKSVNLDASNNVSALGTVASGTWNGTAIGVGYGGTGLTSGTSGGVPYYSATSTIASSAALAANALVVGGGAGAAPATVTTGTGVVTALGVNTGSAGAFVVNGGALGTPSSGTLSSTTVDGTNGVGYVNIPFNSQSAAYTAVLSDAGKVIFHPSTDANARTFTIPANSSVAYPVGTTLTFINMTSQVVTIAITTDTMYLSSAGTTGSRSLAQYGSATAVKMTSTTWLISGSGLT